MCILYIIIPLLCIVQLNSLWRSNFTININIQMNYWPAGMSNLSEMHRPLFDLMENVSLTGKATAKNVYGAGGWVAYCITSIWATSNPVGVNNMMKLIGTYGDGMVTDLIPVIDASFFTIRRTDGSSGAGIYMILRPGFLRINQDAGH